MLGLQGMAAMEWGSRDLTPHGALGLTALGTFDRVWMAEAGLMPAKACPSAGAVAVRANSSARTIASAEAFVRGFMPGCSMTVMHKPPGQPDVLFLRWMLIRRVLICLRLFRNCLMRIAFSVRKVRLSNCWGVCWIVVRHPVGF